MMGTRGQLYTIEGVVGALVLLSAVVFSIQSVVLTPGSAGDVTADTRIDLRHEAEDALAIAAHQEPFDFSRLARYWSQSKRTFHGALNPQLGYGSRQPPGAIGELLNESFNTRSRSYNLYLRYRAANESKTLTTTVVFTGEPDPGAVVATRTIALYDNQTLTAPRPGAVELWQYDTDPLDGDDGYYPIPNAIDGPLYNVVEVRLVVW